MNMARLPIGTCGRCVVMAWIAMKSKFLSVILAVSVISGVMDDARACAEIFIRTSNVNISARNFDFFTDGDGVIRFSPVGTIRQAQYTPPNCQPLKWTSQYASVAFNLSVAKTTSPKDGAYEAGVDGINQAGLKVGTYFLPSSVFPKDGGEATIDIGSLMQYLLDNCKSVDEALADWSFQARPVRSTVLFAGCFTGKTCPNPKLQRRR